jgi:hypothetical protein
LCEGGVVVLVEKSETLAKDEVGEEGAEGGLVGVGPEGEEKEDGDDGPGPEERLEVVELEHGLEDGDGGDGEWRLALTAEEGVESVGGGHVDVVVGGDVHVMVAVEEEAEASADDRTHAHVRRRRGGGGGGVVMQASEPAECGVRSARCDGGTRRWCWITGPSAGCEQLPRPGMVEAYQRRTQSRLRGDTDGGKEGGGGGGKERARKSETMVGVDGRMQ